MSPLNSFCFNKYGITNDAFGLIFYYVFSACFLLMLIMCVFFFCFCALWLLWQNVNDKELN
jgi:hypothetical protein